MKKLSDTLLALVSLVVMSASMAQAVTIVTTNPADIAAFLSGTTIENFDDLSALAITSYSPANATGFTFSSRDANNAPTFDSGGATPSNPASNPGIPVGIVAPTGAIAGQFVSSGNVAGPLNVAPPPLDVFSPGAFMEVAFPQAKDATKVGFYVTHGTVNVNIQDDSLSALESTSVPAGSFVGFTRGSPDIRNVSLTSGGAFTIDNFAYAFASTGEPPKGVPDGGSTATLIGLACLGLWFVRQNKAAA